MLNYLNLIFGILNCMFALANCSVFFLLPLKAYMHIFVLSALLLLKYALTVLCAYLNVTITQKYMPLFLSNKAYIFISYNLLGFSQFVFV